nr:glycosyltransferase [Paracoccaceae bacterium]
VGDGPLRELCDALIDELALGDRVSMHGTLDYEEYVRLMRRASLFVQHSVTAPNGDTEGFPVSIMEAMSTGLPVVSTRHSGIPEGVEEGVTGLLVAEGDTEAMAAAMTELLADPPRAARMGAAGRSRVLSHFTQQESLSRLRAILEIEGRLEANAG